MFSNQNQTKTTTHNTDSTSATNDPDTAHNETDNKSLLFAPMPPSGFGFKRHIANTNANVSTNTNTNMNTNTSANTGTGTNNRHATNKTLPLASMRFQSSAPGNTIVSPDENKNDDIEDSESINIPDMNTHLFDQPHIIRTVFGQAP